ncbi:MAG: GtrA family protein [Patescibacteria group bacterium]|mgnify:CR=1 FL=1
MDNQQIYSGSAIASAETGKQAGKFAIVGVINTVIDVAILNILVFVGLTATLVIFGQKFLIANIISVAIAMVNSYILNKKWTFQSSGGNIYGEIAKFLGITIIGMFVVHQIIFNVLYFNLQFIGAFVISIVHLVRLDAIFSDNFVVLNFAKVIAIIGSLIWNFVGYKFIVFKK